MNTFSVNSTGTSITVGGKTHELTVEKYRRNSMYVAICKKLKCFGTSNKSYEAAENDYINDLRIFLEVNEKRERLTEVLKNFGFE